MSDQNVISAEMRDRAGKGAARAVRRAGRVPAVIYGDKKDPVMVSLEPRELRKQLNTGNFFATVYSVEVADGDNERVLPRDVQFHPVKDETMHVDFLRVSKLTRTNVMVQCNFINEEDSPGLTRGGMLNVVRHEIEVICGVDDIPSEFELDLTGLDIGDSIHASVLKLPEGVELTIADRDFTIATIAAPVLKTEEEEEEEAAAAAAAAEGEEGEAGEAPAEEGAEEESSEE
ncbi:MAG: 50S ribosomal protein L25/general stress protein Ctc [Proteobacteria bacterium]|nr:50S ribosomal protein L25/general stress protein Ctc [Pseudomonadota bacterium]